MSALLILLLAASPLFAAEAALPVFPLATKWTVDIPAPPVAGAVPVSDDERVYVAIRTGQIIARRNADGAEVWRRDLATERPLAADNGLIFVTSADAVHALRARDGATVWEAPTVEATAPVLAHGGWVVAAAGGKVLAFRASDGTPVWQRDVGAVSVRPAIDGARLYVAADDGRIVALNLLSGEPLWEQHLGAKPSEPLPWGERVYVGGINRRFYCLTAKNGEIAWEWRVGASVNALPTADNDRVYFVGLDNMLRALDRVTGVQKWQQPMKRRPAGGPVVMQHWVLVPSSSSPEIWAWTSEGRTAGVVATPAEPSVAPQFVEAADGARIYVITGSLTRVWQLTLIGTSADPPIVPLNELPGALSTMPGTPVSFGLPLR